MGIKKIFKKKEPTERELVDDLQKIGISTKTANSRQEKFGAFRQYAHERQSQRSGLAPANPYADVNSSPHNPYMQSSGQNSYSEASYEDVNSNPYGTPKGSDDVVTGESNSFNPYASQSKDLNHNTNSSSGPFQNKPIRSNPYEANLKKPTPSGGSERYKGQTYDRQQVANSYGYSKNSSSMGDRGGSSARDDESTLDLNDIPTDRPPVQMNKPIRKPLGTQGASLDLNELPDEDLNVDFDNLSDQEQINSEDEEVEAIKQDIRFTKQESVASTRNTLRMAQEAEASGTNTLGMLGSQSERLYNAEQNLLLADTQTKIADEKVRELGRLNRSIFVPATGNPFNKKSRLRQQESKLKSDKLQEKYLRDTNRKGMYASEQRLTQGITNKGTNSEVFNKYQGEKQIQQAQRYQFENDSEDDEMEKELASNLDQISNYSKKLKNTAKIMGQEVDAQNDRLRRIEEDADRLDINVHLNSSRLNNIR
ncbi:hypothetical protein JCM33374_g175 [Metschnikowia sp. JCM 33374]|nr:hypothetical protein JCM33374_g175 [Metschnikowia sp. JCM 33374]